MVHLDGLHLSGDVGGGEGDDITGAEDASLNTADGNGADTADLVHVLEGQAEGLVRGAGWGLKQVEGLSRPLPLAFTVVGYVIAFSLMSLSLKTIPIGIAYAVWSGVGIVAISIIGLIAFGQRLDAAALAGIALIVSGVAVIQMFSKSQA